MSLCNCHSLVYLSLERIENELFIRLIYTRFWLYFNADRFIITLFRCDAYTLVQWRITAKIPMGWVKTNYNVIYITCTYHLSFTLDFKGFPRRLPFLSTDQTHPPTLASARGLGQVSSDQTLGTSFPLLFEKHPAP